MLPGQPVKTWKLPYELHEISGLAYIEDSLVACVQDEEGAVYIYNLSEKKIKEKIRFGPDGDYEGIAYHEGIFYVTNSSGRLHIVAGSDKQKVKTPLKAKNNVEGLCFYPPHSLLMSLKDAPYPKRKKKAKTIVSFDLQSQRLDEKPFLKIDVPPGKRWGPSGIAVNPQTGEFYIISHLGKKLLIFSKDKTLSKIYTLPRSLLEQPEGICFLPSGDFLIASEGKYQKGKLLLFNKLTHEK